MQYVPLSEQLLGRLQQPNALRRENLFGDTDAQFNNAVQNLPSVKAARERAMQPGLQSPA